MLVFFPRTDLHKCFGEQAYVNPFPSRDRTERVPSLADDYIYGWKSRNPGYFIFDEIEPMGAKNEPLVLHMECLKLCDIRL